MEKINELLEMWKKDSNINKADIPGELLKISKLHGKYLHVLSTHKLYLKDVELKYNKMKKDMYEYYTGKMDRETLKKYNLEPFQFLLKSDITLYLEADERLQVLMAKKEIHQEIISICNFIIKELNSRTFQLKSYIDYQKFINGVN